MNQSQELNTYDKFIAKKEKTIASAGFEPEPLDNFLFDWQKILVAWAIRKGRCALFEECGMGKTVQQLEWARQVCKHTSQSVLILTPLAVAEQTINEGIRFGIVAKHIREPNDFWPGNINVTNYERLHKFEHVIPSLAGVVLDESSAIKSFDGKTRLRLTELFAHVPYRLCCTATPAPNDWTELGTQAEFLGICTRADMLATWFINDASDTGTWRLKKHAADAFWKWVASWAACVTKPSDLGFPDGPFILPQLRINPVWVDVDESEQRGDDLFRLVETGVGGVHREQRITSEARAETVARIIGDSKEPWLIWCSTNYEADALTKALAGAVEIRGSDTAESKEATLVGFIQGDIKRLVSKASIAGYGLNLQHCSKVVYFPTYSFEDWYQAIRRCWRYGQINPVDCYMVLPKTLGHVLNILNAKLLAHQQSMRLVEFSAQTLLESNPKQIMNDSIETAKGNNWTLYHGDCFRVAVGLPTESIDFSVFSPPFHDLFIYSSDPQDMGNNADLDDFAEQFGFLVSELFRVIKPGRLCAVHCSDLMAQKWKEGVIRLKDFSGLLVSLFEKADWLYHSRVTIWKDPVVEMQRTKALGLLHKQLLKDSSMCRVGLPDYILLFRKPGENRDPIDHERDDYPVEQWQADASPVWMDINQTRVLNRDGARENRDERHICPLQLGTIERLLRLYTQPGDLVLSPFAGIGSEGVCALKMNRRFVGIELKRSYWESARGYLAAAESEALDLFTIAPRHSVASERQLA